MPLLLAPEGPAFALLSVWRRQVSIPLVYQSYFPREVTQLPRKGESMLHWESENLRVGRLVCGFTDNVASLACTRMTGGGTCMIQSKGQIGLVTKMLFII